MKKRIVITLIVLGCCAVTLLLLSQTAPEPENDGHTHTHDGEYIETLPETMVASIYCKPSDGTAFTLTMDSGGTLAASPAGDYDRDKLYESWRSAISFAAASELGLLTGDKAEFGLDTPTAVVELTGTDGSKIRLETGADAPFGGVYAALYRAAETELFIIDDYTADIFMRGTERLTPAAAAPSASAGMSEQDAVFSAAIEETDSVLIRIDGVEHMLYIGTPENAVLDGAALEENKARRLYLACMSFYPLERLESYTPENDAAVLEISFRLKDGTEHTLSFYEYSPRRYACINGEACYLLTQTQAEAFLSVFEELSA